MSQELSIGSTGRAAASAVPVRRAAVGKYVPEIDGLRALAAFSVVTYHSGLMPFGWGRIWLFYVISGFVITRSMAQRDWRLSGPTYRRFLVSRARRLWPLYFLIITLTLLANTFLVGFAPDFWDGAPRWDEVLSLVTFTKNFQQMAGYIVGYEPSTGLDHLWTMSVEQQFYLVFPFAFVLARRYGAAQILIPIIVLAIAIRSATTFGLLGAGVPAETVSTIVFFSSAGQADAFAAGMLLAFFESRVAQGNTRYLVYTAALLAMTLFLARVFLDPAMQGAMAHLSGRGIYAAAHPYLSSHPNDPIAMITLYSVAVLASIALIAAAVSPASRIRTVLRWQPLVWFGKLSFGIYIWHRLPVFFSEAIIGPPFSHPPLALRLVALVIVIAVSVGLATLSLRYFEHRFHTRIAT